VNELSNRELPQKGTTDDHGASLSFWRAEGIKDWKFNGIALFDSEPGSKEVQGLR